MDELHDLHVSLSGLWGRFARDLRERLLAADTLTERFDILGSALLARIARPLEHHRAVSHALVEFGAGHPRSIAEVTDATGLSARRLVELFRQQVGMPPKQFCRVQRFQRVIRRLTPSGPIDWADVAAANGYFDQAHLIHDFRAIAGISPGEYAAARTPHLNHVPMK
jgi:transcriptional regulator GlxA family with amidase domain